MDAVRVEEKVKTAPARRKIARAKIKVVDVPTPAASAAAQAGTQLLPAPRTISFEPSKHLLHLKSAAPAAVKKTPIRIPLFSDWQDRQHLRDIESKTLSVRSRNAWEFPPAGAEDIGSAARIAFKTLFVITPRPLAMTPKPAPEAKKSPVIAKAAAPAPVAVKKISVAAPEPVETAPPQPLKTTFRFALATLAILLPFGAVSATRAIASAKSAMTDGGRQAVQNMRTAAEAAKNGDFKTASTSFSEASEKFRTMDESLGLIGKILRPVAKLIPAKNAVLAAPILVDAGRRLADDGKTLTEALAQLDPKSAPAQKALVMSEQLHRTLPGVEKAFADVSRIDPSAIPAPYRETFSNAKKQAPQLTDTLRRAELLASLVTGAVGSAGTRRYLIVFQNNAELRATGGFIGSFALLDVNKGEIANLEIPGGGSYDLKGSLKEHYAAPQPMRLINPLWQFQDSNWSPDFPTSAQTVAWFYEKSGGPTVDGVIAVNASFMENLLEVTGPIAMPEYGKTLTSRNFFFETQKQVEMEYDKTENKPKQFISDMSPKVLSKIMQSDRNGMIKLAGAVDRGLAGKDIQLWFRNEDLQSRAGSLGWTGALMPGDADTLAVVHTNIAGQKTDGVMDESIDHRVKILSDGTSTVTLTISRKHNGKKNALFNGVRNVDYLRVYVPAGSRLVEAAGFEQPDPKLFKLPEAGNETHPSLAAEEASATVEPSSGTKIWNENGLTVFGNWVQTDTGETSVVKMIYALPAGTVKVERPTGYRALFAKNVGPSMSYSLLVKKQPGAKPARLTSSIELPRGYDLAWQSPARGRDADGRWTSETNLDRDLFLAAVAK
ncbi:DUF4012 domain-containing protein [Candidatus Uhrbacteria bacterium]|nr:DUF4012 domain-containing protein [Candidatus Uhrbacteria bacterium]